MLAISFWSTREKSICTPSTKTKGASLNPRILICVFSPPGNPEFCLVITPGIFPAIKFDVFATGTFNNSSSLMVATDPVIFIFSCEP